MISHLIQPLLVLVRLLLGKSTRPCLLVSTLERATEQFGVFQLLQRQLPTRFGPTTRAVRPRPPLRSPSTTRLLVRSNTSQRTTPGPTIPTSTSDRRSSTKRAETAQGGQCLFRTPTLLWLLVTSCTVETIPSLVDEFLAALSPPTEQRGIQT